MKKNNTNNFFNAWFKDNYPELEINKNINYIVLKSGWIACKKVVLNHLGRKLNIICNINDDLDMKDDDFAKIELLNNIIKEFEKL